MATFNGAQIAEQISGSSESDAIFGGGGNDTLKGLESNDRVYGEEGDDILAGGLGNDTLVGGNGNDILTGNASGGEDRDTFFGGNGNDIFDLGDSYRLNSDSDLAVIEDFKSGEDEIRLAGNADLYDVTRSGSNRNIYYRGNGDENALVAIVKSNSDLSLTFGTDFSGGQTSGFDIEFDFADNNLSNTQRAIVEDTAERWSEVIVRGLPSVGDIDDLLIEVNTTAIDDGGDGTRNILGQGNSTELRSDSSLPYEGFIRLDIDDVDRVEANGTLDELVLHEIGHVLGVGTLWDDFDLLTGAGGNDPRFTGAGARAEYNRIFGVNELSVPVENEGSPGTRDSHWRETDFDEELMTGTLDGNNLPLSRVTVASLGDLGYEVNLDAANEFEEPDSITPKINPGDAPIEIL